MSHLYDADYFLRGKQTGKSLYEDYRWMPDLTIPMAKVIVAHLGIEHKIPKWTGDSILDFGCARGYLVRALRYLGYRAYGLDASEWAVNNCDTEVRDYVALCQPVLGAANGGMTVAQMGCHDWVIAKDVLEHVDMVAHTIDELMLVANKGVFVVVPIASDFCKYDVPEYELDVTHQHRKSLCWWLAMFTRPGWSVEARYRLPGVKDNYAHYPTGNGFITARRLSCG